MLAALVLTLGYAAAVCVGLVFLFAGVDKLRHRRLLAGVVANYRLLPEPLVAPVAALLPLVELAIGIALIAGEAIVAPLLAILLLMGFAAGMAINLRRGRSAIDCGCGQSHLRQTLSWPLVGRNLLLAAALLLRVGGGMPAPAEIAVAIAGGGALLLIIRLFNTLLALSGSGSSHAHR